MTPGCHGWTDAHREVVAGAANGDAVVGGREGEHAHVRLRQRVTDLHTSITAA